MHVDVADMVTLLPIPADFLWSLYVQLRLAQVRLFRLKTIDVVLQANTQHTIHTSHCWGGFELDQLWLDPDGAIIIQLTRSSSHTTCKMNFHLGLLLIFNWRWQSRQHTHSRCFKVV